MCSANRSATSPPGMSCHTVERARFPQLRLEWVLRNEGHKVILYLLSTGEVQYLTLDPRAALVTSLLDGTRIADQLVEDLGYILSCGREEAANVLNSTVEQLNLGRQRVILGDRPPDRPISLNPIDYIVPSSQYHQDRRLSRPLSLLIYPSGQCQTNCVYCYADLENIRRARNLPMDRWLHILDDACALDIRMLTLSGGDALSRPDSIELLIELLRRRFLFMVSTKCRVTSRDACRLAEAGFNSAVRGVKRYFQISLDSTVAETAARLTGTEAYLHRAIDSITNLTDAGIHVRVKAVVTSANYLDITSQVEALATLGVRDLQFSSYELSKFRPLPSLTLTEGMRAEVAAQLTDSRQRFPDVSITGNVLRSPDVQQQPVRSETTWMERAGCSAGRTNLCVAPNGRVFLCETMPLREEYMVGDLTRQSIAEVWNSPELLAITHPAQEAFAETPCYDCAQFKECVLEVGTCFRDSLFAYGRLHSTPPQCPKAGSPNMGREQASRSSTTLTGSPEWWDSTSKRPLTHLPLTY